METKYKNKMAGDKTETKVTPTYGRTFDFTREGISFQAKNMDEALDKLAKWKRTKGSGNINKNSGVKDD